jgi:hypothetical protein
MFETFQRSWKSRFEPSGQFRLKVAMRELTVWYSPRMENSLSWSVPAAPISTPSKRKFVTSSVPLPALGFGAAALILR